MTLAELYMKMEQVPLDTERSEMPSLSMAVSLKRIADALDEQNAIAKAVSHVEFGI